MHLQVEVSGNVYDIAVDIGSAGDQVGVYQQAIALPDGAWTEGWHDDNLSYVSLGLHVAQFPLESPTTNAASLESLLEGTSQISIFCTGYSEGNGCHDVHYEDGTTNDGALVLNPLAASPTLFSSASYRRASSFALPVSTPRIVVSQMWHPRLDADRVHRWLRGVVHGVCQEQSATQAAAPPRRSRKRVLTR